MFTVSADTIFFHNVEVGHITLPTSTWRDHVEEALYGYVVYSQDALDKATNESYSDGVTKGNLEGMRSARPLIDAISDILDGEIDLEQDAVRAKLKKMMFQYKQYTQGLKK